MCFQVVVFISTAVFNEINIGVKRSPYRWGFWPAAEMAGSK